ncbi:hypothetical protein J0910_13575 [Nocardiopsis sp. CNT-189]|uniref:hypothetical protein n=1 Tax=Nocardiopsis oceanisediminis TaxID=2816862 RepID=UPI003B32D9A3
MSQESVSEEEAARLRTKVFARVIGPYMTIFTGVIALRLPEMESLVGDPFADPFNLWILGALMIAGGLVVIGGHRNWRGPAAVAISLFGWFVGLRGIGLIVLTSPMQSGVDAVVGQPGPLAVARVLFGVMALFGLWLAYHGWAPDRRTEPRKAGAPA